MEGEKELSGLCASYAVSQRSNRKKIWLNGGTKTQSGAVKVPTRGDIKHVAKVTNRPQWESVPEDWRCPGCDRTKQEIVRPSKNFAWSFPFRTKHFRDPNNRWGYSNQAACDDCGHTGNHVAKEAAELAGIPVEDANSRLVELAEIAGIIVARPHSRHRIDNDKARNLVRKVADRLASEAGNQGALL